MNDIMRMRRQEFPFKSIFLKSIENKMGFDFPHSKVDVTERCVVGYAANSVWNSNGTGIAIAFF